MKDRLARPFFVEIVGVAGSGKSTLCGALTLSAEGFGLLGPMRLRDPRQLRHVMKRVPGLLPILARAPVRNLSWTDIKLLLYLESWDRSILRFPETSWSAVVADQGPVYALARLERQTRFLTRQDRYLQWWEGTIERWSASLDLIVWLDAPDDTLMRRINGREQGHEVKGGFVEEARDFIESYRAAYERVISAVERDGGAQVVSFDTSQIDSMALASRVEDLILKGRGGGNRRPTI